MGDTFHLDISAAMAALELLGKASQRSVQHLAEAVAMAAFKGERQAKQAATSMIYSRPERGYQRTGNLRRTIMAASPEYDHSGDEARAAAGEDLGQGAGLKVTRTTASAIESTVGSWANYAKLVNDGTRYMDPRPFMDEGLKTSQEDLEKFVLVALDDIMQEIMPV
jgi:hypothetical protein